MNNNKVKLLMGLSILCIFLLIGCTSKAAKTVVVEKPVDYFAEMPMFMKTSDYSEKRLMLPVHIYYNKESELYVIESTSSQTVTLTTGDIIDVNLMFKASDVKVGDVVDLHMNWDSSFKPSDGSEAKLSKGKEIITMKLEKHENDTIMTNYSFEEGKDTPLEFKIKK